MKTLNKSEKMKAAVADMRRQLPANLRKLSASMASASHQLNGEALMSGDPLSRALADELMDLASRLGEYCRGNAEAAGEASVIGDLARSDAQRRAAESRERTEQATVALNKNSIRKADRERALFGTSQGAA